MLVIDRDQLIAALEFKSQVGPSFGNNFNNRTEEAIGTAHDLWTAYREGALGNDAARPGSVPGGGVGGRARSLRRSAARGRR